MSPRIPGTRDFITRHLFSYFAVLMLAIVVVTALFGREALADAIRRFDSRWIVPVLVLSLINYSLRFIKWQLLLAQAGTPVPWGGSARIYFACLAMVVTPARVGELFKLAFLKHMYDVPVQRSTPVLIVERLADIIAILVLASVGLSSGGNPRIALLAGVAGTLAAGFLLGRPEFRHALVRLFRRVPWLAKRTSALEEMLESSARLLTPRILGPALALSLVAWFAECLGLYWILIGLGESGDLVRSTYTYAAAVAAGNVTLVPGGLGATEGVMVAMIHGQGHSKEVAIAASLLVRLATLWFAVVVGFAVALVARRSLHWSDVQKDAITLQRQGAV